VTLNWPSPLILDEAKNAEREITELLKSSKESWTTTDINVQPNFDLHPQLGFVAGELQEPHTIAVAIQGSFESYFKDKPSPLVEPEGGEGQGETPEPPQQPVAGTIERSPDSARLVVFGSAAFLDDVVFQVSTNLSRDRYLNSLKLMQSAVAWSTEDLDLLTIRARGTTARLLNPLTERAQSVWEMANYALALLSLGVIAVVWNVHRKSEQPMELLPPEGLPMSASEVKR
jgi:ABC-2 type transport system permease protein